MLRQSPLDWQLLDTKGQPIALVEDVLESDGVQIGRNYPQESRNYHGFAQVASQHASAASVLERGVWFGDHVTVLAALARCPSQLAIDKAWQSHLVFKFTKHGFHIAMQKLGLVQAVQ